VESEEKMGDATAVSDDDEECCDDWDELSSHYHCAVCHERTSMMGHYNFEKRIFTCEAEA